MLYPLGLLIALASFILSVISLKQSLVVYYDFVAVTIVLGGTTAVSLMVMPWKYWREILDGLISLWRPPQVDLKKLTLAGVRFIQTREYESIGENQSLFHQVLSDGAELIQLGFSAEKIEAILKERIYQWSLRQQTVANTIRSISKYPPAFGLVGTVLGLVSLMRSISLGAGNEEAGARMAVALVATLYGLILSNLVLNPMGEHILKNSKQMEHASEVALQTVLLAVEGCSALEAQEVLNSYLSPSDRVNVLSSESAVHSSSAPSEAA